MGCRTSEGFSRDNRIRRPFEFTAVFERGQRVHTRHFVIHVLRTDLPRARLGLAVSRHVGPAVVRNRWRRLVREAFRHRAPQASVPLDLVVVAKSGAEIPDYRECESELARAFELKPSPRNHRPAQEGPCKEH